MGSSGPFSMPAGVLVCVQANHGFISHMNASNPPTSRITTQQTDAEYTSLPLVPTLSPTDIVHVLSHNINSLPTSSTAAELGVTFDLYHHLSPSIIGLQEMNKNWNCYNATIGRLKNCIGRRWPGSKMAMARPLQRGRIPHSSCAT
jgi:hypothetical protein